MMTTPDFSGDDRILRLNAALDGELDAMSWLELEREMRADPALAAQYRALAAMREAIQKHVPREMAPRALAERVAGLANRAPASRSLWNSSRVVALAASVAAIAFAAGIGIMAITRESASERVAAGLVSDFTRAAIAGQPYDIASSDRHTVKPWLATHATVSAEIADLTDKGFVLEGGRIAIVDRVPAPTLVYRRREHLIALTELPATMAPGRGDNIETIDGFHVVRWSEADLSYVAVSDLDQKELAAFVEAFRQARKAGSEAPGR
jgi:anti-sigma factor RsiW